MSSQPLYRTARIPLLRPLRPPSSLHHRRPFTSNKPLQVTRHNARPQLPYLSQPTFSRHPGPSQQLARLVSTENKRFFKEQVYLATRWTLIGWTFIILGTMVYVGFVIERDERENPTPSEWRFFTRHDLRSARAHMKAADEGAGGSIDWARVGSSLRNCLAKLEDTSKDGKGLIDPADGEGILIPDVGKAGFDISAKSYEWRTGYFEVIMGCAAAAEHLDGMILDKTRGMVVPRDVMIGPSNPDPRPAPPYMGPAPREENCEDPFEKPEAFYMRVLTGQGFTTKQRMDAAFGYANWLEYKGLNDSATEMYRWSVDIAKGALAVPADAVIDDMAVLKAEGSKEATSNLLRAATNLAVHHARTGDLSSALPILLSVLRARREAAVSPFPPGETSHGDPAQGPQTDIGAVASFVRKVFSGPKFPPPPMSGDNPIIRSSEKPTCAESELMLYIGEILFATAPESKEGVAWTRQGVTIAEANVAFKSRSRDDRDDADKCKQCLITGVDNWETMLRRLSSSQAAVQGREGGRSAGWLEFGGWFGGSSQKGKTLDEVGSGLLDAELKQVERLKERIAREGIGEEMLRMRGGTQGGTWIGT